jgi:hypothetical protein
LRDIDEFAVASFRKLDALNSGWRAIENLLVKAVTNARLATRVQVSSVLGLNFAGQIEQYFPRLKD